MPASTNRLTRFVPIANVPKPEDEVSGSFPTAPIEAETTLKPKLDATPLPSLHHIGNEKLKIDGKSYYEHYMQDYRIMLGRNKDIIVGYRVADTETRPEIVLLINIRSPGSRDEIVIAQSIEHVNLLKPVAVYGTGDELTVAYEFVPLSLSEVIANRSLSVAELASIIKQIVEGLLYLERKGLSHAQLTCSNVLIDHQCNVKIWGQQLHKSDSPDALINSLHQLVGSLMSGCENIQSHNISYDRWRNHEILLNFLTEMKTAKSALSHGSNPLLSKTPRAQSRLSKLSQHKFLENADPPPSLVALLHRVRYTNYWFVRCSETLEN